jgi:threonylcarbamoyladenosine tRNA methylthiotransferase MtaB
MRRPYTVAMYRRVVERLTAAIPGAGLGADAIVGFPGESDADFEATLDLVNTLPFSYLHVFPYSERRGTEAAGWSGRVDSPTIAGRARRLRRAATARGLRFRQGLVGRVEDVLVLQTRDRATGDLIGLTGSFVEVTFPGPERLIRRLARVRVTAAGSDGVHGTLEDAA